jgi:4-amino-4-deoxy-L-arabinose transferase-like glycosyltransferase
MVGARTTAMSKKLQGSMIPETRRRLTKEIFSSQRWMTLLIIVLAVIPRVVELGVFRIIDEEHLWEWTEQFTRAVLAGDWAGTAITAYPGLPFFWVQFVNLGLEMMRRAVAHGGWIGDAGVYLVFHEWSREAFLDERRLLLGLVNGVLVVWLYLLVRRLFGNTVGLVAGILLALNPFLLSESRVARVEALSAEFVALSVMTLMLYFHERRWRWLVLSGALGGLALSTKSQNLLLVGSAGLAIAGYWLWHARSQSWGRSLRRMVVTGLLWLFVAILIFVLIWPAMWTDPRVALNLITDYASTHATDPEYQELYFLGKTVVGRDPGVLFYVVVFLWRMTPLNLIGLVGVLIWLVKKRQEGSPVWSQRAEVLMLLIFVLLYVAGMSLGAHKRTRYLLPIFPLLDVIAAVGLVWLGQVIARRWFTGWPTRRMVGVGLGALLLVQAVVVLPHHPYYYDFYNPMLGGGPVAVKLIRVGWGEGMDQVADFLNTHPDPEQLTVATRFGKYMVDFSGRRILLDTTWRWLGADYVVLYVQQVQKMLEPSPGIIRYFQRRTPEHVVRLGGIDYAWVYTSPVQHQANPLLSRIPDKATLLGYSWQETGDQWQVIAVWQNDGLGTGEVIAMRPIYDAGDQVGDWRSCRLSPGSEIAAREEGELAESLCTLPETNMPPGIGGLEFAVQDTTGRLWSFDFPLAQAAFQVEKTGDIAPLTQMEMYDAALGREVPSTATPVRLNHTNRVRLVGYEIQPSSLLPGETLTVRLYWQALQPIELDLHESVKLLDTANSPVAQVDQAPPMGTEYWWPGQVVSDTVFLPIADDVSPPAVLRLDVGLLHLEKLLVLPVYDEAGSEVSRSIAQVKLSPSVWPGLEGAERLSYVFDDSLVLEGMQLGDRTVSPGESLTLDLYWSSLAPVNDDYTVFIHLLDEAGNLVGQGDGLPVNGRYPTSAWSSGERVLDRHVIPVSNQIPPGHYTLVAGLYRGSDGTRLMTGSIGRDATDAVVLGDIYVQ